jgi:hypothetical protein
MHELVQYLFELNASKVEHTDKETDESRDIFIM